jgi:hypothetical protein
MHHKYFGKNKDKVLCTVIPEDAVCNSYFVYQKFANFINLARRLHREEKTTFRFIYCIKQIRAKHAVTRA